jgi:cytidine deaminase
MDQLLALSGPELVFGLVGAVGSDLRAVTRTLAAELERVRYKVEEIHVSSLLHQLDRYSHLGNGGFGSEYERIREHMKAGTELRSITGRARSWHYSRYPPFDSGVFRGSQIDPPRMPQNDLWNEPRLSFAR